MAKLSDISKWLAGVIRDEGRARSLIQLARKDGLFTTGGRGNSAPDMTPDDFVSAILLALVTEAPTKAASAVKKLGGAETESLGIDPRDGGGMRYNPLKVWLVVDDLDLPRQFESIPKSAKEALTKLIEYGEFHDWDRISVYEAGHAIVVTLYIHGPQFRSVSFDEIDNPEVNDYSWEWRFTRRLDGGACGVSTERHIYFRDIVDLLGASLIDGWGVQAEEGEDYE